MSPKERDAAVESCLAAREVLNRIGDKWSVIVVRLLGKQRMRFNELKRAIVGVSQRMLTLTLRGLERDGLVKRTVHPTVPPRVEYELTKLGRTLLEPVNELARWAEKNRAGIHLARERYDATAPAVPEPAAPPQRIAERGQERRSASW